MSGIEGFVRRFLVLSMVICIFPIAGLSQSDEWPCCSNHSAISRAILPNTSGPCRIAAVHTPTAEAPTITNWIASMPRPIPPTPMIGRSTVRATSNTHRRASGLRAGPESQP